MSTRVLYVCTYWGVRSQIAKLLTDASEVEGLISESAGFENGTIGKLPIQAMAARGLELPSTAPPTLFHFSRKEQSYDYVITLCNQQSQENYKVLYDVVDLLFAGRTQIINWDVADFMAIGDVEPEARLEAAGEIISNIDACVQDFLANINQSKRQHESF